MAAARLTFGRGSEETMVTVLAGGVEEVVLDDVAVDEIKEEYGRDVGVAIAEREEGAGALKT
ncbi:hypothetical protein CJF31_00001571 [Rutstroemia sp. NJR-2017a BVV2]|nr:hypothetical protein CJF31_00001571 [Rutstroemia sp. NJR-2017a BVV2]